MLRPSEKLELVCLADANPDITVRQAYNELLMRGYREPGLGHVDMFVNCYAPSVKLRDALEHETTSGEATGEP